MTTLAERVVRSRWYVPLVLAFWIFVPELRRIVDWRSSFHALSLLSVVPLASLVPGLVAAPKIWPRLGPGFRRVATIWLIGFGYSFGIALLTRSYLAALYGLALFCLPIFFGAAFGVHGKEGAREAYDRLANWTLVFVAISALYGIYQYAAPPPWDTYWAQQADIEGSQGATTAFSFRIFGTLNSTGPYADALIFALLVNLPRLSARRWYVGAAFVPIAVALALTSVRACWLGLLAGTVCFLLLAPRRKQAALSLVAIGVLVAGVAFAAASTIRETSIALTALTDRITSFSDLQNDKSAAARGEQSAAVLADSLDEPLGLGLGSAGTALRLTGSNVIGIDNGYLARLSEMGLFGFALYVAALLSALVYALRAYTLARQRGDPAALDLIAVAISFQVVFLTLDTFTDSHYAFPGMFFWTMVCVASQLGGATVANRTLIPRFAERRQTSGRAG